MEVGGEVEEEVVVNEDDDEVDDMGMDGEARDTDDSDSHSLPLSNPPLSLLS